MSPKVELTLSPAEDGAAVVVEGLELQIPVKPATASPAGAPRKD